MSERKPLEIGKRVVKCEQFPNAWQILSLEDIELDKPCVLCFGGNATVTERSANGMAKIAEGLFDPSHKQTLANVYAISYGGNPESRAGNMTCDEVERLARGIFLPRLLDSQGNRYDYEKCAKNFRNISVFSYSFGAKVLKYVIYNVAQIMEYEFQFSEREIVGILKQIYHVSYAPSTKQNGLTSNFELKSLGDEMVDYMSEYYEKFDEDIDEFAIDVEKNTVTVYVDFLCPEPDFRQHNIGIFRRDENGKSEDEKTDKYVGLASKLFRMSVENSIENLQSDEFTPMPPARKILAIVQKELECEKKHEKNLEKTQEITL